MPLGLDMQQAAVGARSLGEIMAAQPAAQAEISQQEYTKQRFDALRNYMSSEVAQAKAQPSSTASKSPIGSLINSSDDPAVISGNGLASAIEMSKQLQQEKASLAQEQARIKQLSPEDQGRMEATLQRRQANIDKSQEKLIEDSSKYLGQNYSALESVANAPTGKGEVAYNIVKDYFSRQFAAAADQAGLTGAQRQKFIDDHIDQSIGKTYNPQLIKVKMDGMMSLRDRLALEQEKMRTAMYNKMLETTVARERVAAAAQNKALQSQDEKLLRDGLKDATDTMGRITQARAGIAKQLSDMKKLPPDKYKWSLKDLGQVENPEYRTYKDNIQSGEDALRELDERFKQAQLNADVTRERLRQLAHIKNPNSENTSKEDEARKWAEANPDDPRAKAILDHLNRE